VQAGAPIPIAQTTVTLVVTLEQDTHTSKWAMMVSADIPDA